MWKRTENNREAVLERMIRSIPEQVMLELNELRGPIMLFWRKREPGRGDSRCKGPEVGVSLVFSRNGKKGNEAGVS